MSFRMPRKEVNSRNISRGCRAGASGCLGCPRCPRYPGQTERESMLVLREAVPGLGVTESL